MNMLVRKAYKFRLEPNESQKQIFEINAGHCRFVWNYFLRKNINRLHDKSKMLWFNEMCDWLVKYLKPSEEYGFLKSASSVVLQQKLMDLEKAFKNAFDKTRKLIKFPKFRKKVLHNSFRFLATKSDLQIKNHSIKIPKTGWVKFRKSRKIEGKIKNATISKKGNHWYIAIQVEIEQEEPKHIKQDKIGIDVGVSKFAVGVTAKGQICNYDSINVYRNASKKLASQQRKLKNKVRFSYNWKKNQKQIQKIHNKILNIRNDYLHKVSTEICKNHAEIFREELKIVNMSKSAKGNEEKHGKNVKAKSGLNKAILDQGWGKFFDMLEYKSEWLGGKVNTVKPQYTSQTCSKCQSTDKENRKTQEVFECIACQHKENADVNAARNILTAGLAGDSL